MEHNYTCILTGIWQIYEIFQFFYFCWSILISNPDVFKIVKNKIIYGFYFVFNKT